MQPKKTLRKNPLVLENKTTVQDLLTNWRDDSISSTKSPEMSSTRTHMDKHTPGWAGAQQEKHPRLLKWQEQEGRSGDAECHI